MRRNYSLSLGGVLLIGVLAGSFLYLRLGPGVRKVSAQAIEPVGSYGVMTNKWTPVLTNSQESSVGVMNFDGAGNVTWTANVYNTKANPHHQTITFQGTYSSNPDGTGTITWIVSPTQTAEFAVVVVDGGAGFQFLFTSENSQEGKFGNVRDRAATVIFVTPTSNPMLAKEHCGRGRRGVYTGDPAKQSCTSEKKLRFGRQETIYEEARTFGAGVCFLFRLSPWKANKC